MLEGRDGLHRRELDKLLDWLGSEAKPDVVTLPYTLLIAMAKPIREAIGRPVVCGLQGEELFLDGLPEPWRSRSLELIRSQVANVDAFARSAEFRRLQVLWYSAEQDPRCAVETTSKGMDSVEYGLNGR
jgi:hypothetical protein